MTTVAGAGDPLCDKLAARPDGGTAVAVERRSAGFLLLYALANAGGVLAYLPLLTLLLPVKVEAMAGDSRLGLLTVTTLVGAVSASLFNIVFGLLSDRSFARRGSRRPWVWAGIAATILSYAAILLAATPIQLVAAIALYQGVLNMMLAPLYAMMADEVPDAQKGVAGGLLAVASPAASIAGALIAGSGLGEGGRFVVIGIAVAAMIGPLLAAPWRPRAVAAPAGGAPVPPMAGRDLARIWAARLCIQTAGNVMSTYLLFYFEGLARGTAPIRLAGIVGHVAGFAVLLSVPLAIAAGRASDRIGRRKPFLVGAALAAGAGLALLTAASAWSLAILGYALFACGNAVFLGLHSAYAMQNLPSAAHRGRDLGILNLTNTLPALIAPALTWLLATTASFRPVLMVMVALAFGAAALIGGIASRR